MPNCFTLTRKGETEPASLSAIDEELCALLKRPIHPTRYVEGWYDSIGFALACGRSWEQIKELFSSPWEDDLRKIIVYLETNYITNAWAER